eukprot:8916032-Pyramimonas_sp.AAC.1
MFDSARRASEYLGCISKGEGRAAISSFTFANKEYRNAACYYTFSVVAQVQPPDLRPPGTLPITHRRRH